jgi:hypothetical protein
MNQKEQRAWQTFRKHVKTDKLKIDRIENQVREGMADLVGVNRQSVVFWIEIKALHAWPKKDCTCPLKDAFEPGQLPFLRGWKFWGIHTYVLLRVDKEYYLLDPSHPLPGMNTEKLISYSIRIGHDAIVDYLENLTP